MANTLLLGVLIIVYKALNKIPIKSYNNFGVNAEYDPIRHSLIEGMVWGGGKIFFSLLGIFSMLTYRGIYIYIALLAILHNWIIALLTLIISFAVSPLITNMFEKLVGFCFHIKGSSAISMGNRILLLPVLVFLPIFFIVLGYLLIVLR